MFSKFYHLKTGVFPQLGTLWTLAQGIWKITEGIQPAEAWWVALSIDHKINRRKE